jgi:hypothetical protein
MGKRTTLIYIGNQDFIFQVGHALRIRSHFVTANFFLYLSIYTLPPIRPLGVSMALCGVAPMSKKPSASEIHDKGLPGFKVPKNEVPRVEVNDSAVQYEDPWEDEFDSEKSRTMETRLSKVTVTKVRCLISNTHSLIAHNFALTMQTWMLILQRATKKRRPHLY